MLENSGLQRSCPLLGSLCLRKPVTALDFGGPDP
jgi:hypothetical protein